MYLKVNPICKRLCVYTDLLNWSNTFYTDKQQERSNSKFRIQLPGAAPLQGREDIPLYCISHGKLDNITA